MPFSRESYREKKRPLKEDVVTENVWKMLKAQEGLHPGWFPSFFNVWKVRSSSYRQKGSGVDKNIVINCDGEFYNVLVYFHYL